jgi:hypothetical protein
LVYPPPTVFHQFNLRHFRVAAVAERAVFGMFAAAPRHGFGFGEIYLFWRKA